MKIELPFKADAQFAETGEPSMRALNNPSVPAQALLACHADMGDAGGHATALQVTPAATVRSLVGM